MKKLALTIAIVLGLGFTAFADPDGGGMLRRGENSEGNNGYGIFTPNGSDRTNGILNLPPTHGSNDDYDEPLGSGIAVLVGLGAAYMVAKKRKEE